MVPGDEWNMQDISTSGVCKLFWEDLNFARRLTQFPQYHFNPLNEDHSGRLHGSQGTIHIQKKNDSLAVTQEL